MLTKYFHLAEDKDSFLMSKLSAVMIPMCRIPAVSLLGGGHKAGSMGEAAASCNTTTPTLPHNILEEDNLCGWVRRRCLG